MVDLISTEGLNYRHMSTCMRSRRSAQSSVSTHSLREYCRRTRADGETLPAVGVDSPTL